jgi:hypothetical protein
VWKKKKFKIFTLSRHSRTNSQEWSTHAGGIASRVTMRPGTQW